MDINPATHAIGRPHGTTLAVVLTAAVIASAALSGCDTTTATPKDSRSAPAATPAPSEVAPAALVADGQRVFRFDTFGDEQLWTETLRLHEVVEKSVDPTTALEVGLKVDTDVLPPGILERVDLTSPATTVALLKMNAVVGLRPL